MLRYAVRPISDRTWQRPGEREQSRFTATWSETLDLLERELRILDASDLVIEVDVREQDIRNDGMLRANARSASPAVVVAFETRELGALQYRLDRFERPTYGKGARMESWQHNVRGIAKTLESLRAVDRYGPTRSTQQYQGYRAIGSGPAVAMGAGPMTVEQAAGFIAAHCGEPADGGDILAAPGVVNAASLRRFYALAARRLHPDAGGSTEDFQQLQDAKRILDAAQVEG